MNQNKKIGLIMFLLGITLLALFLISLYAAGILKFSINDIKEIAISTVAIFIVIIILVGFAYLYPDEKTKPKQALK